MPVRTIFVIKSGLASGAGGVGFFPAALTACVFVGVQLLNQALEPTQIMPEEIEVADSSIENLAEKLGVTQVRAFGIFAKYANFRVMQTKSFGKDGCQVDEFRSKCCEGISDDGVSALETLYQQVGFETKLSNLLREGMPSQHLS